MRVVVAICEVGFEVSITERGVLIELQVNMCFEEEKDRGKTRSKTLPASRVTLIVGLPPRLTST